jgi:hypothetical protein
MSSFSYNLITKVTPPSFTFQSIDDYVGANETKDMEFGFQNIETTMINLCSLYYSLNFRISNGGWQAIERQIKIKSKRPLGSRAEVLQLRKKFAEPKPGLLYIQSLFPNSYLESFSYMPEPEKGFSYRAKEYSANIVYWKPSKRGNARTVLLSAHHDIVNPLSPNCNDNKASIAILADLVNNYIEKIDYPFNVKVVIFDREEAYCLGAIHHAKSHKTIPFIHLNLELCALGDKVWHNTEWHQRLETEEPIANNLVPSNKGLVSYSIRCPGNDARAYVEAMRKVHRNNFESARTYCIGLATFRNTPGNTCFFENSSIDTSLDTRHWNVCHNANDNLYSITDMHNMSSWLTIFLASLSAAEPK